MEKTTCIAFIKYFLRIHENLKRDNCVYIFSSKHTYGPMSLEHVRSVPVLTTNVIIV